MDIQDQLGIAVAGPHGRCHDFLHCLGAVHGADAVAAFCPPLDRVIEDREIKGRGIESTGPPLRYYSSHEDLLRDGEVDAVVLATSPLDDPADIHLHALDTVRRGKHLLMDGLLASEVAAGEVLAAAAEDMGVTLAVAYEQRRMPAVRELKRRLKPERTGTPLFVTAHVSGMASPMPGAAGAAPAISVDPLSRLYHQGAGMVDLLTYLFGDIELVSVLADPRVNEVHPADAMVCSLLLEGGLPASLSLVQRSPLSWMLRICSTRSVCSLSDGYTLFVETDTGGEILPLGEDEADPLVKTVEDFTLAIQEDEKPEVGASEGLQVVRFFASASRFLQDTLARRN